MNNVNITFSIPKEMLDRIEYLVGKKNIPTFITVALTKALVEKMEALFIQAQYDPHRIETIQDWSSIEGEEWTD